MIRQCIALTIGVLAFAACSGEPGKKEPIVPSTWRPFKDLPDALYYEGFERNKGTWDRGILSDKGSTEKEQLEKGIAVEQDPGFPSGHAYKLGEKEDAKNDKIVWARVDIGTSPLRMPYGNSPNNIHLQFNFWTDEAGDLTIKFIHAKGDYADGQKLSKVKTWFPVTLHLSDARNGKAHPELDHVVGAIELHFKPRDKKEVPTVFMDDFTITLNAKPMDIMPRVLMADKKRAALEKVAIKDGFFFNAYTQDKLKTAIKPFKTQRKPKTVLVYGSTPEMTQDLVTELVIAQKNARETGYTFIAAADPNGAMLGGLFDMRTFLLSNLEKSGAGIVLLGGGLAEAIGDTRPGDSVRVVLERAMSLGAIPIYCAPPASISPTNDESQKERLSAYEKAIDTVCSQLGVPWINEDVAVKGVTAPFDGTKLGAQSIEKISTLMMAAVKHTNDAMKD